MKSREKAIYADASAVKDVQTYLASRNVKNRYKMALSDYIFTKLISEVNQW